MSTREITNRIKLDRGCESPTCPVAGMFDVWPWDASSLDFDHIDPATKYRTRSGKIEHPSDMIKGGRYSLATVLAEIAKCRVLCSNCHKEYTHTVQRKRG